MPDAKVVFVLPRGVGSNRGDLMSKYGVVKELHRLMPDACVAAVSHPPGCSVSAGIRPGLLGNVFPSADERGLYRKGDVAILWTCGHDYTDEGSVLKIPHVFLRCLFARLFGKPFFIVAQGAGPIKRRLSKFFIRMIGRICDFISLRDPESVALFASILRERDRHKLRLSADMALLAVPEPRYRGFPEKPIVGINIRQWFHLKGQLLPYAFRYKLKRKSKRKVMALEMQRLMKNISVLADYCVSTLGAQVMFIPMYPQGAEAWEIDTELSETVISNMRFPEGASIFREDPGTDKLLEVFAGLSAMVGVRLHSTIAATAQCVPSIHISYSPKGRSYFNLIGMNDFLVDIKDAVSDIGGDILVQKMSVLWPQRDAIRRRLVDSVGVLRERSQQTLVEILRRFGQPVGAIFNQEHEEQAWERVPHMRNAVVPKNWTM